MFPSSSQKSHEVDWWERLGLRADSVGHPVAGGVLRDHRPVGFAAVSGDGPTLSLEQVVELLEVATQEAAAQRRRAAAVHRAAAAVDFESAFTMSGGEVSIESGRWAGFTRREATAWCWNLFQYEPHGFVHPGTQVRAEALAELRAGGLPEVFGYPERAKQPAESGMTPRRYREYREALGARVFDPAEVRFN